MQLALFNLIAAEFVEVQWIFLDNTRDEFLLSMSDDLRLVMLCIEESLEVKRRESLLVDICRPLRWTISFYISQQTIHQLKWVCSSAMPELSLQCWAAPSVLFNTNKSISYLSLSRLMQDCPKKLQMLCRWDDSRSKTHYVHGEAFSQNCTHNSNRQNSAL